MNLDSVNNIMGLVCGVLVVLGAVAAWFRWLRPKARQAEAVGEAILGRPEVTDRSGAVIQPSQPGMVAQVAALTETVRELVKVHHRMDGVESAQAALGERVKILEDARVERVVTQAESAHAWRAIANAQENDS